MIGFVRRRPIASLFIICVVTACVSLLIGIQFSPNREIISPGTPTFDKWMKASDQDRVKIFKAESKTECKDITEAARTVSYVVKSPTKLENHRLLGVFIAEDNTITQLYDKGVYINQRANSIVPDYNAFIQERQEGKEKGNFKSDKVPELITINGFSGIAIEPGFNDFGDYKQPRPGFVEWYENGTVYTVFGDNLAKAQLIKIGESMTNVLDQVSSNSNLN